MGDVKAVEYESVRDDDTFEQTWHRTAVPNDLNAAAAKLSAAYREENGDDGLVLKSLYVRNAHADFGDENVDPDTVVVGGVFDDPDEEPDDERGAKESERDYAYDANDNNGGGIVPGDGDQGKARLIPDAAHERARAAGTTVKDHLVDSPGDPDVQRKQLDAEAQQAAAAVQQQRVNDATNERRAAEQSAAENELTEAERTEEESGGDDTEDDFDPGDSSVEEIKTWAAEVGSRSALNRALRRERAGHGRVTAITAMEQARDAAEMDS